MPPHRPPTSGYARLAQTAEDEYDSEDDAQAGRPPLPQESRYEPIQPSSRHERMPSGHNIPSGHSSPRRHQAAPGSSRNRADPFSRRHRSNSGVDIKAINARLERWADEIAAKFRGRGRRRAADSEQPEIQHSVFQAPDWIRPATEDMLGEDKDEGRMSRAEFEETVGSVRRAIERGTHPTLISQGSSGSYFARDTSGKIVGVFKPKDEEPYASRNPKWTKWIHRNLFPFGFGRACLIPNLSYVSEAAAYVLDVQLRTNIVPYTDVVALSSKSFFYDFWDRRAYYRKKKPLPEKQGSFQVFLKGYKDATLFLKEHPWPDQHNSRLQTGGARKKRRWTDDCRPSGSRSDNSDDEAGTPNPEESDRRRVFWTDALQLSFREQLEKLVILDYIMRNTDRGLDNWMIRIDQAAQTASVVAEPPNMNGGEGNGNGNGVHDEPYKRQEPMMATSRSATPAEAPRATVRIGAIDNSLSWPWKHPDAWRSYPFGWLFLPVSLIGQPFTPATRAHFLPLLTSKKWWSDTQLELRKCFSQDADFQEGMFARQIAVMKGQAWNVVEALKTEGHGPLELARRARVCVWDDLVDVPVVVPMRAPSPGRRRRERPVVETEEGDISNALGKPSTGGEVFEGANAVERGEANIFNTSRQPSATDLHGGGGRDSGDQPLSPDSLLAMHERARPGYFAPRHGQGHKARMSFDEHTRRGHRPGVRGHVRRLSLGAEAGWEDDEGDLGYAAAVDGEGLRKRVIVERLETVKGRGPVFTWC
ncbi:hypothetical protein EJ06DRAFT_492006 [Trichodelitschia bisporula]|uniref:Phosphatidylinositol 4-kinase n=1 Tax=Trichodelitschia bisporula TaxID=703511 RepID=A0A6G1I1T0_9PEZI|nr:hypothetical protein EJ06DRAFT_492006 [Trichodelitschia bisporula]